VPLHDALAVARRARNRARALRQVHLPLPDSPRVCPGLVPAVIDRVRRCARTGQYAIDAAATVGIDRLVTPVAQQAGKPRYRMQRLAQAA